MPNCLIIASALGSPQYMGCGGASVHRALKVQIAGVKCGMLTLSAADEEEE